MDITGRWHRDCGSEVQYNSEYDAYYCELCNQWLEKTCDDPECDYCINRPEKPSQTL